MKNLGKVLFFTAAILYLAGCSSSQKDLPGTDEGSMPEWFLNPPTDPNYLYSAKTDASADMQMAIDKATTSARAELSRMLELELSSLQKKFMDETGFGENSNVLSQFTEATKIVTKNTLVGSKIKQNKVEKDKNTFRAYVLVELPLGAAKSNLLSEIKNNNELKTRFEATQTFKELDEEVKKMGK